MDRNGSEFVSKVLDKWAYDNQVALDFSRLGKPTDTWIIFWGPSVSFKRTYCMERDQGADTVQVQYEKIRKKEGIASTSCYPLHDYLS
jgi:hypothetical protein